jgi:hypothetical protein
MVEMQIPKPLRPLYDLWMKFAHVLGIIMSTIILTVFWIVAIGLYAIILKIISIPKLWKGKPSTYWIESEKQSLESMKHQF